MNRILVLILAIVLPVYSFAGCPSIKSLSQARLNTVMDDSIPNQRYFMRGQLIDVNNPLSKYWNLRVDNVKASNEEQALKMIHQALSHGLLMPLQDSPSYDRWGTATCSYMLNVKFEDQIQRVILETSSDVDQI